MKKILSFLGFGILGLALVVSAQVSTVSQPNFFKYIGTSIVPTNASSTIGTTTRAVAGGYFNNLTVSGTCTGCSGSGNATTSIAGVTSNNFTIATTTSGSVFSFATSSNTITFNFPVNPTFNTITTALTGSSLFGTTTITKLISSSSAGIDIYSSGNSQIVNLGAGGGQVADFKGAGSFTSYLRVGASADGDSILEAKATTNDGSTGIFHGYNASGTEKFAVNSNGSVVISGTTTMATTTMNGDFTLNGGVISRTVAYTASTSVTILTDTTDIATITVAHATTTFETPTGTLWNGKMFEIMLTATTTRGLAWSTGFASSTDLAMPITTASGTAQYIYQYRSQSSKWELLGLLTGFEN